MMQKRLSRRWVLSGTGLVCILLLVSLASAAGQATSGTLSGKTIPPGQDPVQHPDKSTPVPQTTRASQTPAPAATTVAPAATQTTDTSSIFSSPAVIAAGLGLVSAAIGAGVTLYTHAKKK